MMASPTRDNTVTTPKSLSHTFQNSMRHWRKARKLSQLELALIADVSQRHISWLETGRSLPSREMVMRLAEAMEMPNRDRNAMLNAAGFADVYTQRPLTAPEMDEVREILGDILSHHSPYPAMVIDRNWNVLMKNKSAEQLLASLFSDEDLRHFTSDNGLINLAYLTFHPSGIRRYALNWEDTAPLLFQRLKQEASQTKNDELAMMVQQIETYIGNQILMTGASGSLLPILTMKLIIGGDTLELCSVISTFGTAQDITADELRIETFYPANQQSRRFLNNSVTNNST